MMVTQVDALEQLNHVCGKLAEATTETNQDECVALFSKLREYANMLSNSPLSSGKVSRSGILRNMHNPPNVRHDVRTLKKPAHYRHDTDTIHTVSPKLLSFDGWYEHILFHELAHSVDHKTRLGPYHSYKGISPEAEIGAELASVFIQLQCGTQLRTDQIVLYIRFQLFRLPIPARYCLESRVNVLREAAQIGKRQARYILGEVTA